MKDLIPKALGFSLAIIAFSVFMAAAYTSLLREGDTNIGLLEGSVILTVYLHGVFILLAIARQLLKKATSWRPHMSPDQ
jgi:hypothetical protein